MTFNLRYGTAQDGDNSWVYRREAALKLVAQQDPDVLGVQEALAAQVDELRAILPEHDVLGAGREDGLRGGEHSAIFTRRSKLGLREGGTRWISNEPLKPGSLAFEARNTRVFTWGEFFLSSGRRVLLVNCHLDHESADAQLMGAQHMLALIHERNELPAIVTGDFNCEPNDPPVSLFVQHGFVDARPASGPFGTFNNFEPHHVDGVEIDHILATPSWQISNVTIDRSTYGDRAISDHFPVIADLALGLSH